VEEDLLVPGDELVAGHRASASAAATASMALARLGRCGHQTMLHGVMY
jgi:hypothetical protein